jgi:TetR/AcrR family transcriptional regulator, transcriptional repressor for nem operon
VYYYFKTRDDLLRALIDRHAVEVRSLLSELERQPTPRARLKALAESWALAAEEVADHGCQVGCLAWELTKTNPGLAGDARGLLEELVDWSERQFRDIGLPDPRALATSLIAGVQGAAVLADVLGDPGVMRQEARRLERWIDELCGACPSAVHLGSAQP